jgi:hypothetical protein
MKPDRTIVVAGVFPMPTAWKRSLRDECRYHRGYSMGDFLRGSFGLDAAHEVALQTDEDVVRAR